MLHVTTGANGAGKTLNTLKWVRDRQIKENRPVCHNGRFDPVEGGELSSWKKIEFKDWQAEPDGTIFLIDEAHNDLPVRPAGQKPPEHVAMLAEHRKRGFDFYFITQHPSNLDKFVRALVGPPGWHRHLKRMFGGHTVSMAEYNAVNMTCEKAGVSKDSERRIVRFPKEVFGWYKSTSLDTTKRHIPKQLIYFVGALVAVPLLIWSGVRGVGETIKAPPGAAMAKASAPGQVAAPGGSRGSERAEPLTAAEYVKLRAPRIPGLPHTAAAYDEVTKPVVAPIPAACVSMKSKGCRCYSQQGTVLDVNHDICMNIVVRGFFVDWQQPAAQPVQAVQNAPQAVKPVEEAPRVMEVPIERSAPSYSLADVVADYRVR